MSQHDIFPPTIVHISPDGTKYTFKWVCKKCWSSVQESWITPGGKPPPRSYVPMNLLNTHGDCDNLAVERILKL